MRAGALPAPDGFPVTENTLESDLLQQLSPLRLPTIVRPSREDAGGGIEPASIAGTASEVIERCRHILQTDRQPEFIEELIDGPNGLPAPDSRPATGDQRTRDPRRAIRDPRLMIART